MLRRTFAALILIAGMLPVHSAFAGIYADDLSRCLVTAAKPQDQQLLVQWMFAAMSSHPAVQPLATVTSDQRENLNHQASDLFVRLITADCRTQSTNALKYEGPVALTQSFGMLGQVAVRGLMTDPHVAQNMKQLGTDFAKNKKAAAFLKAAGVGAAAPAK